MDEDEFEEQVARITATVETLIGTLCHDDPDRMRIIIGNLHHIWNECR
jgi:hypothetical protein